MQVDHVVSEREVDLVLDSFWPLFDMDKVQKDIRKHGWQDFRDGLRPIAVSLIKEWSRKAQLDREGKLPTGSGIPSWQLFKLPSKPGKLYRIICPGSNTNYFTEGSFTSRTRRYPFQFEGSFKQELTLRFNWEDMEKDDFIAVRDDEAHAIAWGKWWEKENPGKTCRIATMGGAKIMMPIYRAKELIERLHIRLRFDPSRFEDEYLVLHSIPKGAVECVESLEEAIDRIENDVPNGPVLRQKIRPDGTIMTAYILYWVSGYKRYGVEIPQRLWRAAQSLPSPNRR